MSIESYLIYVLGKKILPNYWTKVWNSGHGVYPDSRKRKGFMHKIITKIIEPTKTITQSMKKQFVTLFIRFCPFKNRDEVLLDLGCLNVKLLKPWVIFVKVLWSRYVLQNTVDRWEKKAFQILISPSQISTTMGILNLKKKIHFHPLRCKDKIIRFFWHPQHREKRVLYGTE